MIWESIYTVKVDMGLSQVLIPFTFVLPHDTLSQKKYPFGKVNKIY